MLTKEKIIDSINKMPESFSMEELMERIILLQKIEEGLDQVQNGQVIADEELSAHLPEWLR